MTPESPLHSADGYRPPRPLTPLIGREADVAVLLAKLGDRRVRLVTLTGPGGVGKTRLALELAALVRDRFGGRVSYLPLAPVEDPRLLLPTVGRAFGVAEGEGSVADAIAGRVGADRWLLILDNLEHLLAAAPELVALLRRVDGLTLLATSRAALRVGGEHRHPVTPLDLPPEGRPVTAADLDEYAGLRLFVDRAGQVAPDFAPDDVDAPAIAEICRRLGGLPLAIELAAARVDVLPVAELARRLRDEERALAVLAEGPVDAPERLRSMEAAIAWSYGLLSPAEQALFRRLSVFVGGFTLGAVAAMVRGRPGGEAYPIDAGTDPAVHWSLHVGRDLTDTTGRTMDATPLPPLELEPMDGLQHLLDQSLAQRTVAADRATRHGRFGILEPLREFGLARLTEAGEEHAVRSAHAAWTLAFAEDARESIWNVTDPVPAARIDAELGNIRAALGWAKGRGDAEAELRLRLPQTLWLFWQTRGLVGEGRRWLEPALIEGSGPPWDRATAGIVAGFLAWAQRDLDRADEILAESLAFWERTPAPNQLHLAQVFMVRGLVAWSRGDLASMVPATERSLAYFSAWEMHHGVGTCAILLGIAALRTGETARAVTLFDGGLTSCEVAGFGWGAAASRLYAGEAERARGDVAASARRSVEALDRFAALADPWGTGAALAGLAVLAATVGEAAVAARLLGASAALRGRAEAFLPVADDGTFQAAAEAVRGRMGAERFGRAAAVGSADPRRAETEGRRLAQRVISGSLQPSPADPLAHLPPRQRDVLRMVAAGKTAREIANALYLSERTVERHAQDGLRALGIARAQLIAQMAGQFASQPEQAPQDHPNR